MEKNIKFYRYVNVLACIIFTISIILPIMFWNQIPDTIPTHYGASGMPDAYGDKSSLILIFVLELFTLGSMFFAGFLVKLTAKSNHATKAEKSSMQTVYPMLAILNLVLVCMFAYMTYCSAMCLPLGEYFLIVTLAATFLPIVYYLYKYSKGTIRQNKMELPSLKEKEQTEQGLSYRTKIDWWLGGILILSIAILLWVTFTDMLDKDHTNIILVITDLFLLILIIPLFYMKYTLYKEHLKIQCGIFGSQRISYDSITNIKKTSNPLSSAAMSLKRIQIDYVQNGVHGFTLISPIRRDEFIEELKKRSNLNE